MTLQLYLGCLLLWQPITVFIIILESANRIPFGVHKWLHVMSIIAFHLVFLWAAAIAYLLGN